MKLQSILVAAMMMISAAVLADEPASPKLVVLSQKESGLFKVIYENAKTGKVKMTILNSDGEALYAEQIKVNEGFILPVNFKGMTPGEYSIEVADGAAKTSQKVSFISAARTQNVHVAKLSNDANKYLLSIASEGAINVRILDGANNIIHEENVNANGPYGVVYNLKAVSGTPTFEVTDNEGNVKTIKY